jgi:hypothetical protein
MGNQEPVVKLMPELMATNCVGVLFESVCARMVIVWGDATVPMKLTKIGTDSVLW